MSRSASRHAMQRAARNLSSSSALEGAFEELNGVHPLDSLTNSEGDRDARRRDVRFTNSRAGRRIAFVCDRENRGRTKSTAQLAQEAAELADLVREEAAHIVSGRRKDSRHLSRALAEYRTARTRLAIRKAETAQARRERVETNAAEEQASADLAPLTGFGPEPPGLTVFPSSLTRRASLTVRPTVERLTRTLALAPGAPSLPVCV